MEMSDHNLLLRTRDGHEPAARSLWERHAPRLIAYARAILARGVPAEDVVQAVFCRVVGMDRGTLKAVEDVPAWLTVLVRREALNAMRSVRRERGRAGAVSPREVLTVGVHAEVRDELRNALELLPRRLREVVTLKHGSGLTFDQLAVALGLNRSTVAARYRSAIGALKVLLGTGEEATDPGRADVKEVVHGL